MTHLSYNKSMRRYNKERELVDDCQFEPTRNNNEYISIVAGGHVGSAKFMPMIVWVRAKSREEAVEKSQQVPRVKHGQKHSVIACEKRSMLEGFLVWYINKFHDYMITTKRIANQFEDDVLVSRFAIEGMKRKYYENKSDKVYTKFLSLVKTADDFTKPEQVLQRAVAPIKCRDELTFKKVDFNTVLPEYFNVFVKKYAVTPLLNGEVTEESGTVYNIMMKMLVLYAKIFENRDNELKVCHYKYENYITILDTNCGEIKNFTIPEECFEFTDMIKTKTRGRIFKTAAESTEKIDFTDEEIEAHNRERNKRVLKKFDPDENE